MTCVHAFLAAYALCDLCMQQPQPTKERAALSRQPLFGRAALRSLYLQDKWTGRGHVPFRPRSRSHWHRPGGAQPRSSPNLGMPTPPALTAHLASMLARIWHKGGMTLMRTSFPQTHQPEHGGKLCRGAAGRFSRCAAVSVSIRGTLESQFTGWAVQSRWWALYQ
jgi:hypothetical protein